eukprot:gb/GECH01012457.1/.p1 GENE.gb/GECH01012457.1/~~gb/GECH01012457.1/.p1  ORF type:complete len:142 (+),score=41.86 gb/GECH01012457.1/:1-426(+)
MPRVQQLTEDNVVPIATPITDDKASKKVAKLVKQARKERKLHRGVREVQRCLKRNRKGIVLLAADVTPFDVIAHFPILCEELDVPYVYMPNKQDLGSAAGTKRATAVLLVAEPGEDSGEKQKELYQKIVKKITSLHKKTTK